jgi:hypothetical protein
MFTVSDSTLIYKFGDTEYPLIQHRLIRSNIVASFNFIVTDDVSASSIVVYQYDAGSTYGNLNQISSFGLAYTPNGGSQVTLSNADTVDFSDTDTSGTERSYRAHIFSFGEVPITFTNDDSPITFRTVTTGANRALASVPSSLTTISAFSFYPDDSSIYLSMSTARLYVDIYRPNIENIEEDISGIDINRPSRIISRGLHGQWHSNSNSRVSFHLTTRAYRNFKNKRINKNNQFASSLL